MPKGTSKLSASIPVVLMPDATHNEAAKALLFLPNATAKSSDDDEAEPSRECRKKKHSIVALASLSKSQPPAAYGPVLEAFLSSEPPHEAPAKNSSKRKKPQPLLPSSKAASRLYATFLMFSAQLPIVCPQFISSQVWATLRQAFLEGTLVQIVRFAAGTVTVRVPESYDIIIHSRANYGPSFVDYTSSLKTRFRWWSDCAVAQLRPIKNSRYSPSQIERSLSLPVQITAHPYMQSLFAFSSQHHLLLRELSDFFASLLQSYLHPDDKDALDHAGFGRTRRKLRLLSDAPASAFDDALVSQLARWDREKPDLSLSSLPLPPPQTPNQTPNLNQTPTPVESQNTDSPHLSPSPSPSMSSSPASSPEIEG